MPLRSERAVDLHKTMLDAMTGGIRDAYDAKEAIPAVTVLSKL